MTPKYVAAAEALRVRSLPYAAVPALERAVVLPLTLRPGAFWLRPVRFLLRLTS